VDNFEKAKNSTTSLMKLPDKCELSRINEIDSFFALLMLYGIRICLCVERINLIFVELSPVTDFTMKGIMKNPVNCENLPDE